MSEPDQQVNAAPGIPPKSYMQGTTKSSPYRNRAYKLVAARGENDAHLTLQAEIASSLASIRRILIWVLVIIPIAFAVLVSLEIIITVTAAATAPSLGGY